MRGQYWLLYIDFVCFCRNPGRHLGGVVQRWNLEGKRCVGSNSVDAGGF